MEVPDTDMYLCVIVVTFVEGTSGHCSPWLLVARYIAVWEFHCIVTCAEGT